MKSATESSFDIAVWFMDRARADDAYLQPRMLQSLLFVAQGVFAATHDDAVLMPSVFVMDDCGPVEPNIYKVLERGRPEFPVKSPPPELSAFLESVWERFGKFDALRLGQWIDRLSRDCPAGRPRNGATVTRSVMREMFRESPKVEDPPARRPSAAPKPAEIFPGNGDVGAALRPDGSPVIVQKWVPGRVAAPPGE